MTNGVYDFEGHAVPKEKFKKKLKHGDMYCEKHDEMKLKGSPWDTGPFDSGTEFICPKCSQELMNRFKRTDDVEQFSTDNGNTIFVTTRLL